MSRKQLIYINELSKYDGKTVTLNGWIYNKRESKTLVFLILRDGTGLLQCIVSKDDIGDELFEVADSLTQESSVTLTGRVQEDERSTGGFELHVTDIKVY